MHIGLLGACLLTLCSFANANAAKPAGDDWQTLFDGKTLTSWRASEVPGTFAPQAHDPGSEVHYRNIKVRVLP
jgi:hypothetical protein